MPYARFLLALSDLRKRQTLSGFANLSNVLDFLLLLPDVNGARNASPRTFSLEESSGSRGSRV